MLIKATSCLTSGSVDAVMEKMRNPEERLAEITEENSLVPAQAQFFFQRQFKEEKHVFISQIRLWEASCVYDSVACMCVSSERFPEIQLF